jgi:hypothetical protein
VKAKPRPKPTEAANDAPVAHISQEEAVAHIQALLDAKRERDRQPPGWPTSEGAAGTTPSVQPGNEPNPAPKAPSPEATHANTSHERGDQQKNKG